MAEYKDIDDEWADFVSAGDYGHPGYNQQDDSSSDEGINELIEAMEENTIMSADLSTDLTTSTTSTTIPKASDIYISTKTKISYLTMPIDLKAVFWAIPIMPYAKPCEGIIKKQIKINSTTPQELADVQEKLKNYTEAYYEEHIITSIDNPTGRIAFKDIRKISIGISKKDLTSYRCKKKSAFYNCFVLIFRMKVDGVFKEMHVKVFNTGKLEIPGVQNEVLFQRVLVLLLETLQPYMSETIGYKQNSTETVLINSNFKCGFYINREVLYDILKYKYNIQSIYDPCSYPGIQCKFYYNHDIGIQTGSQISEENKLTSSNISEVSFMIFRTGSVLVVGKCDDDVLMIIYEFLKNILITEYKEICQRNVKESEIVASLAAKDKKKKIRKKTIVVDV
jgi:hypothetical protein